MRSRYSAYALGLWDYIIETTHSKNPEAQTERELWKGQILDFSKGTDFLGLEILGTSNDTVKFKALLKQNERDATFIENSKFKKENGRWKYLKPLKLQ